MAGDDGHMTDSTDSYEKRADDGGKSSRVRKISLVLSGAGVLLILLSLGLILAGKDVSFGWPISPVTVFGAVLFLFGAAGYESAQVIPGPEAAGRKTENDRRE